MSDEIRSLHIIGSKTMGGAERWFIRFLQAMQKRGAPVEAAVRRDSELARHHLKQLPLHQLPMRTVWDPLSKYAVSRLIRRLQPPIVQTYMGRATRLTRLPRGGPIVHVSRLGGYYKLAGYRHAHAWIGNTRGLCDYLVANGMPARRVFHIYNFAEPARPVEAAALEALRRQWGLAAEDLLLMTPGRFVPVKGQRYLVEALARLPAEVGGRRLRLLMVGDGRLREELQRLARQLGVDGRIVWTGWQQDPAPWFHLADVVVLPSRDAETLGNVILEAWAYEKPLVVTAFRGAREIARHGEDSLVVPCDDAAALAEGIRVLLNDSRLQTELVAAGRRRLSHEFSEDVIMAQYRELYAALLKS